MTSLPTSNDRSKTLPSRLWEKFRELLAPSPASLRENIEEAIILCDPGSEHDIRPEARSMLLNLLKFIDLKIYDVMVPKADIIAVECSETAQEVLNRFTEVNHSRIPVYRETLDDPLGMIHMKDFLHWLIETDHQKLSVPISEIGVMRPLLFIPSSMRAADLLLKMQSTHIHIAIVVNEYGGTDGLVSIEDLVEEIVGDIADEHDQEEEQHIHLEKEGITGIYIADGRTPIEELERFLDVPLAPDDESVDTLGGLVLWELGHVPKVGEFIPHKSGLVIEILDADPYRVKKVRLKMPDAT